MDVFAKPGTSPRRTVQLLSDPLVEGKTGIRDQVGASYRAGVSPGHAGRLGQYFTPDAVCDLMLAWALRSPEDRLLEPGCGTGRFLLRAADWMVQHPGQEAPQALSRLYGVDVDDRAVELARRQLSALLPSDVSSPELSVMAADFLADLPPGWTAFDAVVGNPPYVRQELLKDRNPQALAQLRAAYREYLATCPEQAELFGPRMDLYLQFLLKATLLLRPGGRLALVLSNSWMDTHSAESLERFLSHWFNVYALMEPATETWFPDAAVNPVILLAERKALEAEASDAPVRLVRFTQPLACLTEETWDGAKRLLDAIETGAPHTGMALQSVSSNRLSQQEPTRPRWSFYLRSETPIQALRAEQTLWRPLSDFARVRYPLKTGINRFFYLEQKTIEAFAIEPEYLHPVLKSAREVTRWEVAGSQARWWVFQCNRSSEELAALGHHGALSYIAWGERQVAPPRQKRQQPVVWPLVASVQGRVFWYQLPGLAPADLLCSRFFDRRFFFPQVSAQDPVLEDQTFYGVSLHARESRRLVAALLNSTVSYLWVELMGRTNLGEGVLQYSRQQMAQHWLPDPAQYNEQEQARILDAFDAMTRRAILPIEAEVQQADRQALDAAIMQPWQRVAIQPEQIGEALCRQVALRRQRAAGRGREEKKKGN